MLKYRPFLIIAIVLAIAVIAAALLLKSQRNSTSFSTLHISSRPSPSASKTKDTLRTEALVTLEEFGDYQCPPCGVLHPSLKRLKQELGPNLNFIFRNLPLTTLHKNALVAAQAAEAARIQNRFWEMHDLLYENQDLWKDDVNPKTIFLKFAADLGLDTARFARDMNDKQVQLRIAADEDAANQLGIAGTPTILIDGRQLRPEVTNPDGVRKGIEQTLQRKATRKP